MQQHNPPSPSAPRSVPPERRLRVAEVLRCMQVTSHMRRITLGSSALTDFAVRRPAQWVKLFVPAPHGDKPSGRAYTIRHFRAGMGEMDIDVVLHGDGPCSTWAEHAKAGDVVQIAGPRSGFRIDPHAGRLLIGGDETALPAIGAILETLPAGLAVDAFVEIPGDADAQTLRSQADVEITWLPRNGGDAGTGTALAEAMMAAVARHDGGDIWFAAEASVVRIVRRHVLVDRAIPRSRVTMSGYWKRGETDFRDQDGDQ